MRKRWCILVEIVMGALTLAATLYLRPSREIRYNGNPLRYWVEQYGRKPDFSSEDRQPVASLRLGTNAIPHLLKWMVFPQNESRFRVAMQRAVSWLPIGWKASDLGHVRGVGATRVLSALTPQDAAPAIPGLEHLLVNHPNELTRYRAASVLTYLGDLGLPVLAAALTNASPAVRRAAQGLQYGGLHVGPVVPQLLTTLADSDLMVVLSAYGTLQKLNVASGLLMPRLIQRLGDPNVQFRRWAAISLKSLSMHQETQSAVPALNAALEDADFGVRHCATNALRAIAPDTLTNSLPKEKNF